MTRQNPRPLAIALASALGLLIVVPTVQAQSQGGTSMREQRAKRMAQLGKGQEESKQAEERTPQYPNATRKEPEAKASGKMLKLLQELQAEYGKDDSAKVIEKAESIAAMPSAGAYEKAYVYSIAGNASADQKDDAKAAEYFRKSVEANALDNNSHFAVMYNLAGTQYALEKYADALATIDRFLAETKSDKPDHLAFRAGILAALDRNEEAAAIYKDLIAKNPTDKPLLMNAVVALQNADKTDQANLLLEDAYKRGMLTEPRELAALYRGYINASRRSDAQKVIADGLAKNILQPGPDLARDYQVMAQGAYYDDKIAEAIELYKKAAPMAADGEAYLNLAKVLDGDGKKAEAKAAAQKALDKGIKKPDEAKKILAR